jgi:hypothetical protein
MMIWVQGLGSGRGMHNLNKISVMQKQIGSSPMFFLVGDECQFGDKRPNSTYFWRQKTQLVGVLIAKLATKNTIRQGLYHNLCDRICNPVRSLSPPEFRYWFFIAT